ncbi:MAG TPA: dienelactone hydrolase family protein [Gammaproteobacteria bacterium]|nr:dienelactone hydrolase family protein [Gammaproteobacteria bacterium]
MRDNTLNPDVASLLPQSDLSRRQFIGATLAVGFALAVRPVSAGTITTPSEGLTAGAVRIPVADGEIPAYRAMPARGGLFPVVLVVQEIFGVHEYIQDVCRRLAKLGYLAVAPALYARQGDPSKLSDIQTIVSTIVARVPDAQVMSDLDATVEWAKQTGGDTSRLGITGFCWGGRIVWLYAAHSAEVKAAVAWYGRLAGDHNDLQPKYPIDLVGDLKAPVLGLYGGADQGIPADMIESMRAALKTAKVPTEIIVYPGAPHGFFADYRPSYTPKAAQDGWRRLQGWFKRFGVA